MGAVTISKLDYNVQLAASGGRKDGGTVGSHYYRILDLVVGMVQGYALGH